MGANPGPEVLQWGQTEGITVTGAVPEIRDYLRMARVSICPISLKIGVQTKVLEAMACGTPVVTSNVSSLPEVGGQAALLVNPMDVDAISDALGRLLQDAELRQQLIARGFDQARQFTWEKSAAQLLDLYAIFGK